MPTIDSAVSMSQTREALAAALSTSVVESPFWRAPLYSELTSVRQRSHHSTSSMSCAGRISACSTSTCTKSPARIHLEKPALGTDRGPVSVCRRTEKLFAGTRWYSWQSCDGQRVCAPVRIADGSWWRKRLGTMMWSWRVPCDASLSLGGLGVCVPTCNARLSATLSSQHMANATSSAADGVPTRRTATMTTIGR